MTAVFQRVSDLWVVSFLHTAVTGSISRIRNREIDLEFTIRSKNQEHDFSIIKQPVSR